MAQRTEKEETEFKVPETLTLCINNCGVTGNPATNNMCQKCFNATTAAAAAAAATTTTTTTATTSTASSSSNSSSTSNNITTTTATTATTSSSSGSVGGGILKFTSGEKQPRSSSSRSPVRDPGTGSSEKKAEPSDQERIAARKEVNRCSGCRRKVGLTGFRCRCGELFCWEHRYSDRHDCSYDYKAAGREAIARENPVVKAAKIVRV